MGNGTPQVYSPHVGLFGQGVRTASVPGDGAPMYCWLGDPAHLDTSNQDFLHHRLWQRINILLTVMVISESSLFPSST